MIHNQVHSLVHGPVQSPGFTQLANTLIFFNSYGILIRSIVWVLPMCVLYSEVVNNYSNKKSASTLRNQGNDELQVMQWRMSEGAQSKP